MGSTRSLASWPWLRQAQALVLAGASAFASHRALRRRALARGLRPFQALCPGSGQCEQMSRRDHPPQFRAKVPVDAVRGKRTLAKLRDVQAQQIVD